MEVLPGSSGQSAARPAAEAEERQRRKRRLKAEGEDTTRTLLKLRGIEAGGPQQADTYNTRQWCASIQPPTTALRLLKNPKNCRHSKVSCGEILVPQCIPSADFSERSFLPNLLVASPHIFQKSKFPADFHGLPQDFQTREDFSQSTWPVSARITMRTQNFLEFSEVSPQFLPTASIFSKIYCGGQGPIYRVARIFPIKTQALSHPRIFQFSSEKSEFSLSPSQKFPVTLADFQPKRSEMGDILRTGQLSLVPQIFAVVFIFFLPILSEMGGILRTVNFFLLPQAGSGHGSGSPRHPGAIAQPGG
jgi:hypothetical protein